METIFGIPASSLLFVLIAILCLIGVGTIITAIRYPVPFRLGLRNLRRRRSQTALIIVGLALSTLIITSALAIGDTVDYSVKSGVYENLGSIDVKIITMSQKLLDIHGKINYNNENFIILKYNKNN